MLVILAAVKRDSVQDILPHVSVILTVECVEIAAVTLMTLALKVNIIMVITDHLSYKKRQVCIIAYPSPRLASTSKSNYCDGQQWSDSNC